jgi:hypothetical protein
MGYSGTPTMNRPIRGRPDLFSVDDVSIRKFLTNIKLKGINKSINKKRGGVKKVWLAE